MSDKYDSMVSGRLRLTRLNSDSARAASSKTKGIIAGASEIVWIYKVAKMSERLFSCKAHFTVSIPSRS